MFVCFPCGAKCKTAVLKWVMDDLDNHDGDAQHCCDNVNITCKQYDPEQLKYLKDSNNFL